MKKDSSMNAKKGGEAVINAGDAYLRKTFGLDGKIALITGSREGLGETIAIALASAGASGVVVTSRSGKGLERVMTEIHSLGSEAFPVALELSDLDQIKDVVAKTVEHFGRIDILVNCAAFVTRSDSLTYPPEEWDKTMEVNLRAPFYMAQAAAPHMIKQGGGRIINIGTALAHAAIKHRAAYSSTKAGLEHMTRILAVEWAEHKITVNVVAPTTMLTKTRAHVFPTKELLEERIKMIHLGQAMGRLQIPEDVAPAVVFLASDAGRFMTGASIIVDGGFSID